MPWPRLRPPPSADFMASAATSPSISSTSFLAPAILSAKVILFTGGASAANDFCLVLIGAPASGRLGCACVPCASLMLPLRLVIWSLDGRPFRLPCVLMLLSADILCPRVNGSPLVPPILRFLPS